MRTNRDINYRYFCAQKNRRIFATGYCEIIDEMGVSKSRAAKTGRGSMSFSYARINTYYATIWIVRSTLH